MTMKSQGGEMEKVMADMQKQLAAMPPEQRLNGNCTRTDLQRSGNTVKFKFECSKPQASRGEGEWIFLNDKAYTGTTMMQAEAGGKPQQMSMDMSGKWLAADCGDVKPRAMPAK